MWFMDLVYYKFEQISKSKLHTHIFVYPRTYIHICIDIHMYMCVYTYVYGWMYGWKDG